MNKVDLAMGILEGTHCSQCHLTFEKAWPCFAFNCPQADEPIVLKPQDFSPEMLEKLFGDVDEIFDGDPEEPEEQQIS